MDELTLAQLQMILAAFDRVGTWADARPVRGAIEERVQVMLVEQTATDLVRRGLLIGKAIPVLGEDDKPEGLTHANAFLVNIRGANFRVTVEHD